MFNSIKLWLAKFKMDRDPKIISSVSAVPLDPIRVEDTRQLEARKAVDKMFQQQATRMEATRMITHSNDCPNVMNCTKTPCFEWKPDLAVSKPKRIKKKTDEQRLKEHEEWKKRDRGLLTFMNSRILHTHEKKRGRPVGSKNKVNCGKK